MWHDDFEIVVSNEGWYHFWDISFLSNESKGLEKVFKEYITNPFNLLVLKSWVRTSTKSSTDLHEYINVR